MANTPHSGSITETDRCGLGRLKEWCAIFIVFIAASSRWQRFSGKDHF
ncbi:MAG: hypothetical protein LIO74_06340 [Ruminococcus sp.]|nr:hypothetical protein [Ruminococcus sp.]